MIFAWQRWGMTIVAGALALALFPVGADARKASDRGVLDDLPPQARAVYRAVKHDGRTPRIGAIQLERAADGRFVAAFSVAYPDVIAPGRKARATAAVRLVAAKRLAANGVPTKRLQRVVRKRRLGAGSGRVDYRIALSPRASKWLRSRSRADRARLVSVDADLRVDVDRNGVPDHVRNAAATVAYSRAATGARASAADNTITLSLVNATSVPIHNIALPVTCMYDRGEEGSNVSGFNYLPGGEVRPGGSHVGAVAANGSAFSSPDFMSDAGELSSTYEELKIATDVATDIVDEIPFLATIEDVFALENGCENNASFFMFTASEARECPEREPGCNLSTTGGWVMSTSRVGRIFETPIDSVVAAANQQAIEFQGALPPWGYSPIEDNLQVMFNPTTQALYPAAFRWLTYSSPQLPCATSLGNVKWSQNAIVGDHGLSWSLDELEPTVWQLEVQKSGYADGWSGANPGNTYYTGNEGSPPWIQQHPASHCSGW